VTAVWREYPVWVPYGATEHLAAVITTPERDPVALVALLAAGGAPKSHKNRMWTRTARALAERDIASVRFDFPGVGDSTGGSDMSWEHPPIGEALAVIDVARQVTQVHHVGVVGNCLGASTGFAVAAKMDECRAVATVVLDRAPELLRSPSGSVAGRAVRDAARAADSTSHRTAVGRATRRLLGRIPGLKKRLRRWMKARSRGRRLAPDVEATLRTKDCFFLVLGETRWRDNFERTAIRTRSNAAPSSSMDIRHVPAERLKGFRLEPRLQPVVIDALVEWFARTLPSSEAAVTQEGHR
jgi:pimeloyl-ACP methyl ester carboxylesterase